MIIDSFSLKSKINSLKISVTKNVLAGEIEPKKRYEVFSVPIDLLTLNPRNSRLQSKFSCRNESFSFFYKPKGQEQISKWILEWHKEKNLKTENDIKEKGQQVFGIITSDGLVVNGNRRLAIIKKLYKENGEAREYSRFKTVILSDISSNDTKEIKKIEVRAQFGKDESIPYKRLDTMLAMREFKKNIKWDDKKIKNYFGWDTSVKESELTLKYIDDYLKYLDLDGKYDVVDGTEDQFKFLSKSHDTIDKNSVLETVNWKPTENDFTDYKYTFFKLFKSKPGQEYVRPILTKSAIFLNKDIWHFFKKKVDSIYEQGNRAIKNYKENKENVGKSVTEEMLEKIYQANTKEGVYSLLLDQKQQLLKLNNKIKINDLLDAVEKKIKELNEILPERGTGGIKNASRKKIKFIASLIAEIQEKIAK